MNEYIIYESCQTVLVKLIDQWMAGVDKGDTIELDQCIST